MIESIKALEGSATHLVAFAVILILVQRIGIVTEARDGDALLANGCGVARG
jgi:hypothetical protein